MAERAAAAPAASWGALDGARSWLFVPGDKADRLLERAAASGADVLILDLEDAVAPAHKEAARDTVRGALARDRPPQPIAVRINCVTTAWWNADLEMAISSGAAAVMLPKTMGVEDIDRVGGAMGDWTSGRTGSRLPCAVVPLLESARGILRAEAIAAARGVIAVALGGEDLSADLGVARTDAGTELRHARGHLVLACASAGCGAIDTPTLDPNDIDRVATEARAARVIGFSGKFAIHPRQVAVINAAFEPGDEEIRWARSVIEGFDQAIQSGSGIAVVDGRMIDEAVVAAARRVLVRSRGLRQ